MYKKQSNGYGVALGDTVVINPQQFVNMSITRHISDDEDDNEKQVHTEEAANSYFNKGSSEYNDIITPLPMNTQATSMGVQQLFAHSIVSQEQFNPCEEKPVSKKRSSILSRHKTLTTQQMLEEMEEVEKLKKDESL